MDFMHSIVVVDPDVTTAAYAHIAPLASDDERAWIARIVQSGAVALFARPFAPLTGSVSRVLRRHGIGELVRLHHAADAHVLLVFGLFARACLHLSADSDAIREAGTPLRFSVHFAHEEVAIAVMDDCGNGAILEFEVRVVVPRNRSLRHPLAYGRPYAP